MNLKSIKYSVGQNNSLMVEEICKLYNVLVNVRINSAIMKIVETDHISLSVVYCYFVFFHCITLHFILCLVLSCGTVLIVCLSFWFLHFYSASALLAMQSAVLARGIPSVCPSFRPSITFRYCVQTNEDTIVRFSASGRTTPLVSGEVKSILISAGDHLQRMY